MKRLLRLITGLLTTISVVGCSAIGGEAIALCGGKDVVIVDMAKSDGKHIEEIWRWNIDEPTEGLPAEYSRYLNPLDECKFVDNGRKLLLTSSHSGTVLMDIKSRKALFYARTPMAHSADLLPNGRIAVANSTNKMGNSIEIYDITKPEVVLFRDSLYSGHGVVWMEETESLFALGYDCLREYKLLDWATSTPSLELKNSWSLPVRSGHDLSRVDESRLLISGHEGVVWFDLNKGTFSPFEPLKSTRNVKSVNFNPQSERLIYTKAEESWWTHNIYQERPDKVITIDSMKIYKVRPLH